MFFISGETLQANEIEQPLTSYTSPSTRIHDGYDNHDIHINDTGSEGILRTKSNKTNKKSESKSPTDHLVFSSKGTENEDTQVELDVVTVNPSCSDFMKKNGFQSLIKVGKQEKKRSLHENKLIGIL